MSVRSTTQDIQNNQIEDEEIAFVTPPSDNLYCPICQELFKNPVITRECSHSFCSTCIYQIENSLCPLCRHKISFVDTHSNLVLDQIVKDLPIYCKYKEYGCPAQVPLGNKTIHESQCGYRPTKCPHSEMGCDFVGTKNEVSNHLKACVYELLKHYISGTQQEINSLRKKVEEQEAEIHDLKRKFLSGERFSQEDSVKKFDNNNASPLQQHQKDVSVNQVAPSVPLSPKAQWGISSFQCVQTLAGHNRGVTALRYSPKTHLIYSGSHDCAIKVWDVSSLRGENIEEPKCLETLEGHLYTVWALVLSADGKRLYSGSSDGTIRCWDTEKHVSVNVLPKVGGKIYTMDIRGNLLFSAGSDKIIRVWDVTSGECIERLTGHTDCIWHVIICGNYIYSSSDDKTVRVWDLFTYECLRVLSVNNKVLSLAVGSGFIATGSDDCKIRVWNAETFGLLAELTEHSWEVWQLQIQDGLLFSGSFDHTIKVWDLTNFTCIKTLKGHKGYVHSVTLGDHLVFSGSGDKTIKVWRRFPLVEDIHSNGTMHIV